MVTPPPVPSPTRGDYRIFRAQGAGRKHLQLSRCFLRAGRPTDVLELGPAHKLANAAHLQPRSGRRVPAPGFVDAVAAAGVRIEGRGRWLDNRFIERLWRSAKNEEIYVLEYVDGLEASRGWAGGSRITTKGARIKLGLRAVRRGFLRPGILRGPPGDMGSDIDAIITTNMLRQEPETPDADAFLPDSARFLGRFQFHFRLPKYFLGPAKSDFFCYLPSLHWERKAITANNRREVSIHMNTLSLPIK